MTTITIIFKKSIVAQKHIWLWLYQYILVASEISTIAVEAPFSVEHSSWKHQVPQLWDHLNPLQAHMETRLRAAVTVHCSETSCILVKLRCQLSCSLVLLLVLLLVVEVAAVVVVVVVVVVLVVVVVVVVLLLLLILFFLLLWLLL